MTHLSSPQAQYKITRKEHCSFTGLVSRQRFAQYNVHYYFVLSLGRAGRVSTGTCYRMVTREFYHSCLPQFGIPEMQVNGPHCTISCYNIAFKQLAICIQINQIPPSWVWQSHFLNSCVHFVVLIFLDIVVLES